jgi:hypothetical protein
MMKFIITSALLLLIASVIVSCNNGVGSASTSKGANPAFDSFKQNFVQTALPLTTKACYVDPSKFKQLGKQYYPLYVDNDEGYSLCWCTFKANGDYTALFTFGPADCYIPYLTTYDKDGKKIDGKMIAIGGCGSDCGFTCEEYMIVRADYSIYTSDTVTAFDCDTANKEIPGTKQHYVIYKTGKILSTGKIELSDEIKLMLKD